MLLSVKNLTVTKDKKIIVKNLSLSIAPGTLQVLMGPNGSGKSTLALALMGHPGYAASASEMRFGGKNIKTLTTDERARLGLFVGMQYPVALSGLSLSEILPLALAARAEVRVPKKNQRTRVAAPSLAAGLFQERAREAEAFRSAIAVQLELLQLPDEMLYRNVNEGFSGGEKKKSEMLQMLTLKPKLALLDEPDSGLDIDSMKILAQAIKRVLQAGAAVLLITHYARIFRYLTPDRVHVMVHGRLAESGGPSLVKKIEARGYAAISA